MTIHLTDRAHSQQTSSAMDSISNVIKTWENQVRDRVKPARQIDSESNQSEFPKFITSLLNSALLESSTPPESFSTDLLVYCKNHGAERAKIKDYTLCQIILEFSILRILIADFLFENKIESLSTRAKIIELLDLGLIEAINEFSKKNGTVRTQEAPDLKLVHSIPTQKPPQKPASENQKDHFESQTVRQNEMLLRDLADALPQIIWTMSPDGKREYFNQRWLDYTGLTFSEVEKRGWDTVIPQEDIPSLSKALENGFKSESSFDLEYRIINRNGKALWHLAKILPVKDAQGHIIKWIGSATQIEQQKQTLNALFLERELREKFVTTLTHDLRTPLTAIRMNAELIPIQQKPENVSKISEKIKSDADRIDQMIQDLLDVSRIRAGKQIPISQKLTQIDRIIQETVETFNVIYPGRFAFSTSGVISIFCDPAAVRRMIENLSNNAIKYGCPNSPVQISLRDEGSQIRIQVNNKGVPIPSQELQSLFQPFQRLKSAQKSGKRGWGIGLTLVKAMTEAHHGTVGVTSNEQDGTTFTICIPKAKVQEDR